MSSARDALACAIEAQRALHAETWPAGARLRVRMGVHTGEPKPAGDCYIGLDVHRASRICAAASGGQVLLSAAARGCLGHDDEDGVALRDSGSHRLQDLRYPEHLFEVVAPGLPLGGAPLKSVTRRPNNLPAQATSFVGRAAQIAEIAG